MFYDVVEWSVNYHNLISGVVCGRWEANTIKKRHESLWKSLAP